MNFPLLALLGATLLFICVTSGTDPAQSELYP